MLVNDDGARRVVNHVPVAILVIEQDVSGVVRFNVKFPGVLLDEIPVDVIHGNGSLNTAG